MKRHTVRKAPGFTLVELMVVVAILAVLASVAIVSFRRYTYRARINEAYGMLGLIRMRQETYRSEFSQYCDVSSSTHDGTSGAVGGQWPSSSPGRTPVDWYAGLPAEWTQLGVRPQGLVYFRYDTVAGNPGVSPNVLGSDLGYGTSTNQDAWWAAHAFGDLDGDGTRSSFEATSLNSTIWSKDESE
jgi:prepilin-type N-terminal cleavage/methylation domain-containing protein